LPSAASTVKKLKNATTCSAAASATFPRLSSQSRATFAASPVTPSASARPVCQGETSAVIAT
jgi:hypothetical protein